jgi:hypothetical protein
VILKDQRCAIACPAADSMLWFDTDAIIHRRPDPLLAAQISLGRLNRNMPQQELDLFQLTSGCLTQFCACPAQVVKREFCHANSFRTFLHNVPNRLFCHALAPDTAHLVHFSKDPASINLSGS